MAVKGIRMKERFSIDRASFPGPVVVTGAGGCIGSWVLALLVRAGVPACAFDLSEDKRRPRLLIAEGDLEKIQWRTGDVSESKVIVEVFEALRPCAVIHLAALQVPFCKADPVAGAKVNVVGTVNVFEAARRLGIGRIAYASSIAAYGAMDEEGLRILRQIALSAAITSSGQPLAFPMHLPDEPLRAYLGEYGSMPLDQGIRETYESFRSLIRRGMLALPAAA